jgi:signal peptidase I
VAATPPPETDGAPLLTGQAAGPTTVTTDVPLDPAERLGGGGADLPPESWEGAGGGGGDGDGTGGGGSDDGRRKSPRRGRWLIEAAVIVVVALVLAVVLRTFVVQTFYIPSGSMEPTLQIGDRILVDKLSYHLHSVHRGDIIVFVRPETENCGGEPVNDLVKRVIGLPNETISLSKGRVLINGKVLSEPWLPSYEQASTSPGPEGDAPYNLARPYHIPANNYFLMGDNRDYSCDSRYWGPINRSLIVGKVIVRIWPLSAFKIF